MQNHKSYLLRYCANIASFSWFIIFFFSTVWAIYYATIYKFHLTRKKIFLQLLIPRLIFFPKLIEKYQQIFLSQIKNYFSMICVMIMGLFIALNALVYIKKPNNACHNIFTYWDVDRREKTISRVFNGPQKCYFTICQWSVWK